MAIQDFGVTASDIQSHWFPQSPSFSDISAPTETVVESFIEQEAARLQGKLLYRGLDATNIAETSPAYANCAAQLELMVALRTLKVMVGQNPEIAKTWADEVSAWFDTLDSQGLLALGDSTLISSAESDPQGPTTHIDEYGLDTGDPGDASDLTPTLRRSDVL